MASESIIAKARRESGLSQRALARRSGTSQPALSSYERGSTSPTLAVAERIVRTSGFDIVIAPQITFTKVPGVRGEPYLVPDRLWRLELADAFASVELPTHLHWSGPSRTYQLSNRMDRARVYEIVLREGAEADLMLYVDGALLIDLWEDLVLPIPLRSAWEPVISGYRGPIT